jgi:hypothetical protein
LVERAFPWSEEHIRKLRKLRAKGMTALQIAKEFGVSRNAVVGKLERLEVKTAKAPCDSASRPKKQNGRTPPMKIREDVPNEDGTFPGVSFFEIGDAQCRWPYGNPKQLDTFRFCAAPTGATTVPYCQEHGRVAGILYSAPCRTAIDRRDNRPQTGAKGARFE